MMSDITFTGGELKGTVSPPPSKSHTHRAIILSALSEGRCTVGNPLLSFDTRATMDAIRTLGAEVVEKENALEIECARVHAPDRTIDVLNSGTTMRLMTGISSLFDTEVTLTGDDSIKKRPMGPLLESLSAAGVKCTSSDGKPPVKVCGPITGNELVINGDVSSQFVSSLIMASPLTGRRTIVKVRGKMVSKPYVDITTSMMKRFGVTVDASFDEKDQCHYFVAEPQHYSPANYTVPADFSSAAFPLVAGGLAGCISAQGMDLDDPQGDKKILDILKSVGCKVTYGNGTVTCQRDGPLKAMDIDLADIPDLFPVVAVLMSVAKGTSRLYGAPHLRFKESDRIALTEKMLRTLGADITATSDGCIINGVENLHGGRIEHCGDHRMFMAAAVASLVSDGPVVMEDDGCWNVSYPGFLEQMGSVGLRYEWS